MPVIGDLNLTISPYTALYTNLVPDSAILASESAVQGRNAVVLDFNQNAVAGQAVGLYARDLGCAFSWPLPSRHILYAWQPTVIPDPETTYNRPSDWDTGGTPGAKFIQGIIVRADSFGVGKTFQLQSSDDFSLHSLLETPATFNNRTAKAFSCVPFVAHSVRIISTDGVAWSVSESELVFQPYPESTMNWTSPQSSLGLVGYGHIREMNIPHISTANLILSLSFDQWPLIQLTIPNSGGVITKTKVTIPANKFKLVQPSLTSSAPFRLFEPELEMKVGQWGRSDSYRIVRPFGGPNVPKAEV